MPSAKRVEYLDICKGIGIILVVWGHVLQQNPLIVWIYAFHMPLFFLLSGYTFGFDRQRGFGPFFIKKARALLVPYFSFAAVTYLYWALAERVLRPGKVPLWQPLAGIFYGIAPEPWLTFNDALWFLTCLFVVEIAFYPLAARIRRPRRLALALVAFSVVGYFVGRVTPFQLPWGIDTAFTAIVFYGFGYLVHRLRLLSRLRPGFMLFLLLPLGGLYALCVTHNGAVNMNLLYYDNFFCYYGEALGGALFALLACRLFARCRWLSFLGMNSLIIMCVHEPVKRAVLGLLTKISGIPLLTLRSQTLWSLAATAITMALLIPLIYIINRHLPFMLGRSKKAARQKAPVV